MTELDFYGICRMIVVIGGIVGIISCVLLAGFQIYLLANAGAGYVKRIAELEARNKSLEEIVQECAKRSCKCNVPPFKKCLSCRTGELVIGGGE